MVPEASVGRFHPENSANTPYYCLINLQAFKGFKRVQNDVMMIQFTMVGGVDVVKKKKAERYIFFFRHDCPQSGCNNNTAKLRLCLESFGILAQESEIFHSSMERPRRVSSLSPKHFFFVQRATTV